MVPSPLLTRIRSQGWDQGCKLDRRDDLYLADLTQPLTVGAQNLLTADGLAPRAVVDITYKPEDSPGMIIVSQLCDLVAPEADEPMCEAIPLRIWPADQPLPGTNSSRHFTIDAQSRLVADQTRRTVFEKAMLPDRTAENLLRDDIQRQTFRSWVARRPSRVPFDDDLIDTIGDAVARTLDIGLGRRPEFQAMLSWRVLVKEGSPVPVAFLVPYDETHPAAQPSDTQNDPIGAYAQELHKRISGRLGAAHERANRRRSALGLAEVVPHTLSDIVATPSNKVSLRQLLQFPAFNLEHLTYSGEAIAGAEPIDSELA